MPRDSAVRRRLILAGLILACLVLLTFSFRESGRGVLHSMQRAGLAMMSPFQSVAARAVEPFHDGYRWARDLWSARRENTRMAQELEKLRGQMVMLGEASEENKRLKELLKLQEADIFPKGSSFVVARVIGRSPTRWQEWVQVDKGSVDGVDLNQPVVGATIPVDRSLSGKGLVGKVTGVSKHAALVQLISDPDSQVAATVQGTRAQGIVMRTDSGALIMDFVERDQPVEEKRVVITSGLGQIFPKGIPIGLVESVGEQEVNIYKQIEIKPFVNLRALEEVMILTNPRPQGEGVEKMRTVAPPEQGKAAP